MKVAKLKGPQLDYWVAVAEWGDWQGWKSEEEFRSNAAKFNPSSNWAHGGQILEREISSFSKDDNSETYYAWHKNGTHRALGDTILEAVMRCYVKSRYGDEVSDEGF
jgi:hypothetical protein